MSWDWVSMFLAIIIVLIFMAIFTLLRTMGSPYIKRFDAIVKGRLEQVKGVSDACRIEFQFNGRAFEILEIKHEVREGLNKVYNSCVLLKAKTNTDFTLHIDDVLNKVHVAAILENALAQPLDYNCFPMASQEVGDEFKAFKICSNNVEKAKQFLDHPEVLPILSSMKAQFSVYGYLMPFVINRGELMIDYSVSDRLLAELVFDPRNVLKHAGLLDQLSGHIESLKT